MLCFGNGVFKPLASLLGLFWLLLHPRVYLKVHLLKKAKRLREPLTNHGPQSSFLFLPLAFRDQRFTAPLPFCLTLRYSPTPSMFSGMRCTSGVHQLRLYCLGGVSISAGLIEPPEEWRISARLTFCIEAETSHPDRGRNKIKPGSDD